MASFVLLELPNIDERRAVTVPTQAILEIRNVELPLRVPESGRRGRQADVVEVLFEWLTLGKDPVLAFVDANGGIDGGPEVEGAANIDHPELRTGRGSSFSTKWRKFLLGTTVRTVGRLD